MLCLIKPLKTNQQEKHFSSKKKLLLFLSFTFIGLLLAALFLTNILKRSEKASIEAESDSSSTVESVTPQPEFKVKTFIVTTRTTFASIMELEGLSGNEVHRIKEAVKHVYDLNKIKAGHKMSLELRPDGTWQTIKYDLDELRYLTIINGENNIEARINSYPLEIKTFTVWGRIDDSLINAINKAGEGDTLALALVESCFGWDIDFYTDLRKGDTFKIYFEKIFIDGKFSGYRNILAAEFVNNNKTYKAFRFVEPDSGRADYYDEKGGSKRREFLRSPFKFTPRITSRFSSQRLHPIRKIYRPHYGVDYAAPVGTPVQATADGRVTYAGWNGNAGRMVRIQHKNHYETLYLHLSGFGSGITAGATVQAGQVIGYVGSSGESTGPHLDYRINYRGKPVNPLSHRFEPVRPLKKEFLDIFEQQTKQLLFYLELPKICRQPIIAGPLF